MSSLQTYGTAYPFDVTMLNQYKGQNLPILYITDSLSDPDGSAENIIFDVKQIDKLSYQLSSFSFNVPNNATLPSYTPNIETQAAQAVAPISLSTAPANATNYPSESQHHFYIAMRPGTLRNDVVQNFTQNLCAALNNGFLNGTPISFPNVSFVVQGPFTRSTDNALIWYIGVSGPLTFQSLQFKLSGVSAELGSGTRSSRIEFGFANLTIGNSSPINFTRSIYINIINQLGSSAPPLNFGVAGSNVLLNQTGYNNTLKLFMQSHGGQALTMAPASPLPTTIAISFNSYPNGNSGTDNGAESFANQDLVNGYSFIQPVNETRYKSTTVNGITTLTFNDLGLKHNPDYDTYMNTFGAIAQQLTQLAQSCLSFYTMQSQNGVYEAYGDMILMGANIPITQNSGNYSAYAVAGSNYAIVKGGYGDGVITYASWWQMWYNLFNNLYAITTQNSILGTSDSQALSFFNSNDQGYGVSVPVFKNGVFSNQGVQSEYNNIVVNYTMPKTSSVFDENFFAYLSKNIWALSANFPTMTYNQSSSAWAWKNSAYVLNDPMLSSTFLLPTPSLLLYYFCQYQLTFIPPAPPESIPKCISLSSLLLQFKNVQLAGNDGVTLVNIDVSKLPGYSDSSHYITIIKDSNPTHLPTTSN